jgi:hypothetical protein
MVVAIANTTLVEEMLLQSETFPVSIDGQYVVIEV